MRAAKVILGEESIEDAINSLDHFDLKLKLLKLLLGAKVETQDHLQQVADSAKTLEDLANISAIGLVNVDKNSIFKALEESIPHHDFSELFQKTDSFASDISGQAKGFLYDNYPDLTEEQLSRNALLCDQWKRALERAVENSARKGRESNFDEGVSLIKNLFNVSRRQGDPVLSQHLLEGIKGAATGVCKTAFYLDDLLELMNLTDQIGAPLPSAAIREQGEKLGLSPQELDQIINSRISLLKRMIEKGEKVYQRFARLLDREKLSRENTEKLSELAARKNNMAALAALGNYNLEWAVDGVEDVPGGQEMVIESLSAGPGSNLLTQWFNYRDKAPQKIKAPLRKLAREVLVQYAVSLGKELIGDRSRGVLESESVRSYCQGDDFSLIDMDETVEHIVSAGKPANMILPEDLRIRQTQKGHRAIALLVDISGSMHGEKLTWCSIAAAMLAYALSPDELALAFFESDTHIVKSFYDKMEIDEVADQLLGLTCKGGTMLGAALDWVVKELKVKGSRRKNALVLTDAAIFDLEDCTGLCRLLEAIKASVTWFVPNNEWAKNESKALAKWSNGTIVRLGDNWKRFPVLISEALK